MNLVNVVFSISLAGLLVLSIVKFVKTKEIGQFVFEFVALAACGGIYALVFQRGQGLLPKGKQPHEWAFVIILYGWTLIGMACHYFYGLLMKPKRTRPPFDWGSLLAPMFASPMVFGPLLLAFQGADIDIANLTPPRLMIFLVAWENGFFWKAFVEDRRKGQRT